MSKDFWTQKYIDKTTGWDLGEISRPLKEYVDQLKDNSIEILIPGAGNCHEGEYLWKQGFNKVNILDISELPLLAIKNRVDGFPEGQLICTDFFELEGQYDLILEQTFFCAINPTQRAAYAKKMSELLKPNGRLVGVMFNFPLTEEGPPFGGSIKEYEKYFKPYFDISKMETCLNSIEPRQGRELFVMLSKKS